MNVFHISKDMDLNTVRLQCQATDCFVAEKDHLVFRTLNGLVYSKDLSRLYCAPTKISSTIVLPPETIAINQYAFYNCHCVQVIGENVVTVDKGSFQESCVCNVTFPKLRFIKERAFQNSCLQNIQLSSTQIIEKYAFDNTCIIELHFPKTLKKIGARAFAACSTLECVTVEDRDDTLEFISNVFAQCTHLEKFEYHQGYLNWKEGTFRGCHRIHTVVLPHVDYIPKDTFKACNDLRNIYISNDCHCEFSKEIQYQCHIHRT